VSDWTSNDPQRGCGLMIVAAFTVVAILIAVSVALLIGQWLS
jgi:Tfp pilus assembly protein PilX